MAFNKAADKDGAPMKRRPMHRRKKVCVFCGKDNVIDYKDTNKLKRYISERDVKKTADNTITVTFNTDVCKTGPAALTATEVTFTNASPLPQACPPPPQW